MKRNTSMEADTKLLAEDVVQLRAHSVCRRAQHALKHRFPGENGIAVESDRAAHQVQEQAKTAVMFDTDSVAVSPMRRSISLSRMRCSCRTRTGRVRRQMTRSASQC